MASVIYSGDERTMLYMHFDTQLTEHTLAALLYMMSELRLSDLLESMHRSARGVRDPEQEPDLVFPFTDKGLHQGAAAVHRLLDTLFDHANSYHEPPFSSEFRAKFIREICTVAASMADNAQKMDTPPEGPTRNANGKPADTEHDRKRDSNHGSPE
jgi:hypothetical protein